jgi:hypothetical protein
MNWIKRLFSKKAETKQCDIHVVVGSKPTELEEPNLNLDGSFIKADKFEQVWFAKNVNSKYGASNSLRDNDYINYHIWEDQNSAKMYKKNLPKAMVNRGSNPNIIFHGGCIGCISQRNHGIDRCKGCQYFKGNWSKPNLNIEGEEADTMILNDC